MERTSKILSRREAIGAVTSSVYATGVYAARGQNPTSNLSDNVFSDGTEYEMATLSGSVAAGYTATLRIGAAV